MCKSYRSRVEFESNQSRVEYWVESSRVKQSKNSTQLVKLIEFFSQIELEFVNEPSGVEFLPSRSQAESSSARFVYSSIYSKLHVQEASSNK